MSTVHLKNVRFPSVTLYEGCLQTALRFWSVLVTI